MIRLLLLTFATRLSFPSFVLCNNFSNMANQKKVEALIDEALERQKRGNQNSPWDCLAVLESETCFFFDLG